MLDRLVRAGIIQVGWGLGDESKIVTQSPKSRVHLGCGPELSTECGELGQVLSARDLI